MTHSTNILPELKNIDDDLRNLIIQDIICNIYRVKQGVPWIFDRFPKALRGSPKLFGFVPQFIGVAHFEPVEMIFNGTIVGTIILYSYFDMWEDLKHVQTR